VLLAEDLLLLLTDDTSGRLSAFEAKVDYLLAGANLVELALMGRVEVSREVKPIRFLGINRQVDRLVVRDPSPTGDAVLDAALQIAIRSEGRLLWAMRKSRMNLNWTLYMRFVSSGMVRNESTSLWGRDRWPVQDSRHKTEVHRRMIEALVEQTTPDTRSAALIALLHTIRHEPTIVGVGHRAEIARLIERRGTVIARSSWAPEAVRDSIDAIIATTGKQARLAGEGGGG
jgi:Golgi phosphoprotein 3 (GPP34)